MLSSPESKEALIQKIRGEMVKAVAELDGYFSTDELAKFPEVKGVFVGGCIKRGLGSRFRRKAHAHNHRSDPFFGHICVLSRKRLLRKNGKLSYLMLHEIAHILTPNHGHDDTWRKKTREIGGRIQKRERKKLRTRE